MSTAIHYPQIGQSVRLVTEFDGYIGVEPTIGTYLGKTVCGNHHIRKPDGSEAVISWHVVRGFREVVA